MQEVNGSIAILGSGETSPNLVSVHRNLINKIDGEVIASLIDTPFGFQENADQLVDKLIEFYDVSLNLEINLASFRNKKYFKSVEYFEFLKKFKVQILYFQDQVVQATQQKIGEIQMYQKFLRRDFALEVA